MNEFFSPENYVKNSSKTEKSREVMLAERGISFDAKGRAVFKASQFIRYAMMVTDSRQNRAGIWFYNYQEKHYDLLESELYRKIFFYIMEQADENIWTHSMESRYLSYFRNKVQAFQTSGNKAGVLQFSNCILDFSDGQKKIIDSTPEHFCNFRLPYNYDENAECPEFLHFLYDIFENDEERVKLVQEIMGACLYYDKCMQYLVVFLGRGSNGKSVLASVIRHMLGDENVSAIALDRLSGDKFSKQNLDGKLLNISSETKSEKVYSTADFKALTGGDSVEVEKKFQDAYTTEIYSKYIVLANEMFQTDDNSDGFYRRLLIIPFHQKYEKKSSDGVPDKNRKYQDVFLEQKLKKELSGIFNFALEGFFRLWKNGFQFSDSAVCMEAQRNFRHEHNLAAAFLNECAEIKENVIVKSCELFPRFEKFCKENHYNRQNNKTTKKKFFQLLEQVIDDENLNIAKVYDDKEKCYYVGMKLKN